MRQLPSLQRHMRAAILHGRDHAVASLVDGNGIAPGRRLAIYCNHYRLTLIEALGATYPALRQVVGEDFFAQVAREFVALSPPRSPCLFEYGEDFPAFIQAQPAARPLPYLRDLGRFEWAISAAYNAADRPAVGPDEMAHMPLGDLVRLRLAPHPSLHLLASPYPLPGIWSVAQPHDDPDARVDLAAGGVRLALFRHRVTDDVVWHVLDLPAFRFMECLGAGLSLGDACAVAGSFDLPGATTDLVLAGAFTRTSNSNPHPGEPS